MTDIIHSGFRCLFRSKLRSFLTIAGIAVGVMSVVVVSSIGEIGKASINSELSGMGMDSLVVSVQSGAVNKLTEEELDKIKSLDTVENAMPLMSIITSGEIKNDRVTVMTWGVNEDADNVIDLEVIHGRLLNRGDILENNNVCVIDEAIALEHYKRTNIVGKNIKINIGGIPTDFEVVGVVKNGVNTLQNMLGGFIPDFVYVPYSVMQSGLGRNNFDQITVKLDDVTRSVETAAAVKTVLSGNGSDFSVDNLLSQKEKMNNILSIATAALSAVAGISLVVSGISIMTVMLVSVSERTGEIGIKKSVGASRGIILTEFLFESELITLIGSLAGIVSGMLISSAICSAVGSPAALNLKLCGTVMLIALAVGGCFGAYPAYKAASLNPVDALRRD
ncbi:MAG: ABC transporter permease [Oscillospiraceae bacterium]|nr:ABC transporter permease [Oscillospiraceae bacterium]